MSIKKGDVVVVLAGKDYRKQGKVLRVLPKADRLVVEGVNRAKKHQKPNRSLPQGGIMSIEAPIHRSNVMLICDHCKKPTRLGKRVLDDGEKVRFCKKCGEVLK
jgi:large subunit ribosomal protein L24